MAFVGLPSEQITSFTYAPVWPAWGLATETVRTAPGLGFTCHLPGQGDASSFDSSMKEHVVFAACLCSPITFASSAVSLLHEHPSAVKCI